MLLDNLVNAQDESSIALTPDPASWRLPNGKMPFGIPAISEPTRYFTLQQIATAAGLRLYQVNKLFELGAIPGQCFRDAPRSRKQTARRIRAVKALEYVAALRRGEFSWMTRDGYDGAE